VSRDIREELESALIDGIDWNVVVENADGERIFELNTEVTFQPASMIKVPIAIVVLKILEERGDTLERIQGYGIGRYFSTLLSAMIVNSEDLATETLEKFAREDNRLQNYLRSWGITHTSFYPQRSTVEDLLRSLQLIYNQEVLNSEFNDFLLNLMAEYTENDKTLLGLMAKTLPNCHFYNKRGTLLNPTVVADMGILECADSTWYLVISGSPSVDSTKTYEDIQSSIEKFSLVFADFLQE
jgi:hypothetical protein